MRALIAFLILLIASVASGQTIDISALIAAGDRQSASQTHNETRPTIAEVEAAAPGILAQISALANTPSRADDEHGPWIAPTDLGAVGRTVGGASLDEQDYLSWCTILARLAATNDGRTESYAVNLSLDGGYSTKGALEIQDRQTIYGQPLSASDPVADIHHIPDWINHWNPEEGTVTSVDFLNDIITITGHGLLEADLVPRISLSTDGTLPTGLSSSVSYWYTVLNDNQLQLSLTEGGGAVNFSDAGTGNHSWERDTPTFADDASPILHPAPKATPDADGTVRANNWAIYDLHIDGHFQDMFVGGNLDNLLGTPLAPLENWKTLLILQWGDNAFGDGLDCTGSPSDVTVSDVCIRNTFSSPFVFGSIPLNHGTGKLWAGNNSVGRNIYRIRMPQCEEMRLWGSTLSSHTRCNGITHIATLIADKEGPFGDGLAENPWETLIVPIELFTSEGITNILESDHNGLPISSPTPMRMQTVTIDTCTVDNTGWGLDAAFQVRIGTTISSGTTIAVPSPFQFHASGSNHANKALTRKDPNYIDVTLNCVDMTKLPDMATVGAYFYGDLHLTYSRTDSTDVDTLPIPPVAGSDLTDIQAADWTRMTFNVLKDSRYPEGFVQDWNITIVPADESERWVTDTLVDLEGLFTGAATNVLSDVDDIIPTRVNLRMNIRNWRTTWFTAVNNSSNSVKHFATYYPIEFRLEHPASGRTWDLIPSPQSVDGGPHTNHERLFHEWNYEGAHTTYRRAFIVTDANKATANTNMANAGHGANCFSVELSKLGSTYWAAPFIADDSNVDQFRQAATVDADKTAVTIEEEITVAGTGADAYRDAIEAAGYTIE